MLSSVSEEGTVSGLKEGNEEEGKGEETVGDRKE